jgi:bacillithiol system protein YtxJ
MNFFKNILGNSPESQSVSKMEWRPITDLGQLNEIITVSNDKLVVIFKHSTRCIISKSALKQFENEFDCHDKVVPYFLDLLEHRNISNEISNRFDVVHQSPQLILIKEGKAVYNASHESIDALKLEQFV